MAKTPSLSLRNLINALTGSEKRYFKLYVGEKIEKESKKTIEVNKNKLGLNSLESLRKQIEDTKLSKEKKEVQIRISLIQKRINSIWKKPALINEDIQAEIQINLAPSGEILKYEMVSSSGNKIFDDSTFLKWSHTLTLTR